MKISFHFKCEHLYRSHVLKTGPECAVDFLSRLVSFMCYVYSSVLDWYFQIVNSMEHTKWQYTYVTVFVKTVLNGTFGITKNIDLI